MEHRTWTNIDKTAWGPGPWQEEPDKEQWLDEETGLACLLKRTAHSGHLCGYVGVPQGHPWYRQEYDALYEQDEDIDVHGGITFAAFCQEDGDEGSTICHGTEPGEDDKVWWLGFDAAHSGDLCPAWAAKEKLYVNLAGYEDSYKDAEYMRGECRRLARQVRDRQDRDPRDMA